MDELKFSKEKQIGKKKKTSKSKLFKGPEKELQALEEELLKYKPNIAVIRIPDAAYRAIFANQHIQPWIKREIASFLKGIPDLTLLKKHGKYNLALCIENKVGGNKMTQGQRKFAERANVKVVRSFEHFQELLDNFETRIISPEV